MKFAAASAGAAVLAAAAASPAAAEPAATDLTVIDQGHVDVFGLAYEDGELDFHVQDDETDSEYAPDEAILAAVPESKTTVPDGFDFIGEPGSEVWILPDSNVPGVLFAGWATERIAAGDFVDDQLTISVLDAEGGGDVALYTVDDAGDPNILFDSDEAPGSWDVQAGGHGHLNWAFTEAGLYKLTVEAEGVAAESGETVDTGEAEYWFWVQQ